ncbi:GGDEF domain-containing protein [Nocardioides pelophilus]|uniref:GGDEF domain-containing protein n=1 Tax=Nocardioides pelophilus TaxID=2172019 RepID=UPI0016028D9B|nr:diguanylate cyclase [Nocardioides pelophilus]
MGDTEGGLSWHERARRVREGEPELADHPANESYDALQDLVSTILRRSFDAVVLRTRAGEYLEVSDSFCALTGFPRAELLGQSSAALGLVEPEGARRRPESDVRSRLGGIYDEVIVRKDGTSRVVECSQQLLDGDLLLVIIRDVTERRLREQELHRLASEDHLTGVLNRRGFTQQVTTMLDEARGAGRTVHLVLADVDGLKAANDQLGHEFGDRTLIAVAETLRVAYGPDAAVGRLGGDEFAVAVSGRSGEEVELANKALHSTLAEIMIGPAGAQRAVSVSLGTASADNGIGTVDRLIALADESQYVAKRAYYSTKPPDRRA